MVYVQLREQTQQQTQELQLWTQAIKAVMIQMVMVTILIELEGYRPFMLVKITAQEVNLENVTLYQTLLYPFPVAGVSIVAGGAALVAGGALAATSTITTGLSLLIGEMKIYINTG